MTVIEMIRYKGVYFPVHVMRLRMKAKTLIYNKKGKPEPGIEPGAIVSARC